MRPNKENIRKWVDALRSGDYQQTTERLKRKGANEFCVWGVACDLYPEGIWIPGDYLTDDDFSLGDYIDGEMPPNEVEEWVGLAFSDFDDDLPGKNDRGWTFEQLADYLEEKYL